ncbi:MAG: RnfABCDGE type electron transport complex subunit C, partial [Oscillospiraceae bacterium]
MRNLHGIKLVHSKKAKDEATVNLPLPPTVTIPMLQHMGVGCTPLVVPGDLVKIGQLIGDSEELFSVPVHSSVSGTVTAVTDYVASSGKIEKQVTIAVSDEQEWVDIAPHPVSDQKTLVDAARNAGLSGLGGAGFPVHVKLNYKNINQVDTLIVNAAECEPYITSDYREMMEHPNDIIDGIRTIMRCLSITKAIIGVEDNKPDAITLLRSIISSDDIKVLSLKGIYPQGAEKVMIYYATGRVLEEGQIPADQGVVLMNVSSVSHLYRYIKTGTPLTHKRITVDGSYVKNPMNIMAPIGTSIEYMLNFAGVDKQRAKKILMGGPMMGVAVYQLDTPIIKNNNAIIVLDQKQAETKPTTSCIRCGKCVRTCPVNLMP